MKDRINEQSAYTVTVVPLSTTNAPYTPTNARYRVDDLNTRTNHVAWTTVTPSTRMTITVPATANTVENRSFAEETKVLTIQTDYGTANQVSDEREYIVKNLEFVE